MLKQLFTELYSEEIANNIIKEIGQAKKWKDNEVEKEIRINTKVNVGELEYTWKEIIDLLDFFKTSSSAQLIIDINKYLETGDGVVDNLIARYNEEFTKSKKKLGLNAKPKQTQHTGNTTIPSINITGQNPDGTFRTEWKNKPFQPFQIETDKK